MEEAPVVTEMEPPDARSVVAPALRVIEPPVPEFPWPTFNSTAPARPPMALPETIVTDPELPSLAVPV